MIGQVDDHEETFKLGKFRLRRIQKFIPSMKSRDVGYLLEGSKRAESLMDFTGKFHFAKHVPLSKL